MAIAINSQEFNPGELDLPSRKYTDKNHLSAWVNAFSPQAYCSTVSL